MLPIKIDQLQIIRLPYLMSFLVVATTLYSSNDSPIEDLIDNLVHSDLLLKMSFTQN